MANPILKGDPGWPRIAKAFLLDCSIPESETDDAHLKHLKDYLNQDPALDLLQVHDNGGDYALHRAIKANNLKVVAFLVETMKERGIKMPLHYLNFSKESTLHLACRLRSKDTVEKCFNLLNSLENPEEITPARPHILSHAAALPDDNGRIPIHYAAMHGTAKSVTALLQINPRPMKCDRRGKTPMDLARQAGNQETLAVLEPYEIIKPGDTIDDIRKMPRNHLDETILHTAARDGYFYKIMEAATRDPNKRITLDDLLQKNQFDTTPLAILGEQNKLSQLFVPHFWVGHLEEAQTLWQEIKTQEIKTRNFDFSAFTTQVNRLALRQKMRPKSPPTP